MTTIAETEYLDKPMASSPLDNPFEGHLTPNSPRYFVDGLSVNVIEMRLHGSEKR